jgi:hypothetical protein
MFSQVANATVRLLLFRGGPQDFPYSPVLVPWLPAAFVIAYFLLFRIVLSFGMSLVLAILSIAGLALATQLVLKARGFMNRFQQTFHSLCATGAVLTLASLPAMVSSAPILKEIARKPELLEQPGAVQVPPLAALALNALNLWNLAVYAHIYRHAVDGRIWTGALIALATVFAVLFFTVLTGQVLMTVLRLAP